MGLKVIRFLRHHFIIAIQFLIIFSTKGVGGARKRGGRYTAMAKKMNLGALRQQILAHIAAVFDEKLKDS